MQRPVPVDLTLLPGARSLLAAHARALPQRDDLCGAFCGALALHAAGIDGRGGEPLDQDAVALAAGTIVSRVADPQVLPRGEHGRRDYRIAPPLIDDASVSGTTAAGLLGAIDRLSQGRLAAIPYSGPWTADTLGGLFALAAAGEGPVTLIANIATRHLWGGRPRAEELLGYLFDGAQDGPPADWDVGHFVCVIGRIEGPAGTLFGIADTYPSLGNGGVYLQPRERLVVALERPGMAPGGMIAILASEEAGALRSGAGEHGLVEASWDNGTIEPEAAA
jgi:hypothetical protein